MIKILILCTGNSCRSQMAGGFLRSLDASLQVYSAGTHPARHVHPLATAVMKEEGIDIGQNRPKNVDEFLNESFDYVITVCDDAYEECPVFSGNVLHRLHLSFDDPASAMGNDAQILSEFRRVRDEIKGAFTTFYKSSIIRNR